MSVATALVRIGRAAQHALDFVGQQEMSTGSPFQRNAGGSTRRQAGNPLQTARQATQEAVRGDGEGQAHLVKAALRGLVDTTTPPISESSN